MLCNAGKLGSLKGFGAKRIYLVTYNLYYIF